MRIGLYSISLFIAAVVPTTSARVDRVVYIGTYTGEASKGIYAFRFDDGSGGLTPLGLVSETPNPSFLTSSTDGRFVFAVNELSSFGGEPTGSVTSFAVDSGSGRLTELSVQPSRGAGPCHLALDRTGRYLGVANYGGGNFALLPVAADGRLQPATNLVTGAGPGLPKPLGHMVGFDAANRFLIAADKGLDRMLVYRFDASTGVLSVNRPAGAALPAGSGPRHFAFHPNGRWVFMISELSATITTFLWDAASGNLTAMGSVPARPAGVTGGTTAEIAVHPNGRFVYGSNRGQAGVPAARTVRGGVEDSIAVFSVGADGALTLVEHESTRGQTPRNFALDPTGRWLIAANQRSNTLAVFSIEQTTGKLSPVGPLVSVGSPVSVLFM